MLQGLESQVFQSFVILHGPNQRQTVDSFLLGRSAHEHGQLQIRHQYDSHWVATSQQTLALILAQREAQPQHSQPPYLLSFEHGGIGPLTEFPQINPDQSLRQYLEMNRNLEIQGSRIERMEHFDGYSAVRTEADIGYVFVRDERTNLLSVLQLPMQLFCRIFPWLWRDN